MNRYIAIIGAAAVLANAAAADQEHVPLRAACVSVNQWPRVIVPLDVRRGGPNLHANDFSLLDDQKNTAKADKLIQFRDSHLGLALIVALDASGSMNGAPMEAIQKGLAGLVTRKRAEDRIAVLSFADDSHWETHWGASEQETQDALRSMHTRGNLTRLYDAVEEAIAEFSKQADKDDNFPMRRCLLVISDGHDEGSKAKLADVLAKVRRSRVRLDAIGLAHSALWLGSLRQLSRTGFGELRSTSSDGLESLMGQGIDSILDMPTVEFWPGQLAADGKAHDIGIEYGPTGLRDQLSVGLPKPFYLAKPFLYGMPGGILFLIASFLGLQSLRARKHVPVSGLVPDSMPGAPAPIRMATVAETEPRMTARAAPIRFSAGSYSTAGASSIAAKPMRVPTELAPKATTSGQIEGGGVQLRLTATAGPYAGNRFNVSEKEYWIGSETNNHLVLQADRSVSGNHACIRKDESFYRLYDNGSLNNTFVNGTPVSRNITLIRPGDRLRVGASEFLVEANQ